MAILPVACRRQEVGGQKQPLLDLGDCLVDGLSDVVNVLAGQAAHVDATAGHQVHVSLFDHVLHLFGCKTHYNTVTVTQSVEEELMLHAVILCLFLTKQSTLKLHLPTFSGTFNYI